MPTSGLVPMVSHIETAKVLSNTGNGIAGVSLRLDRPLPEHFCDIRGDVPEHATGAHEKSEDRPVVTSSQPIEVATAHPLQCRRNRIALRFPKHEGLGTMDASQPDRIRHVAKDNLILVQIPRFANQRAMKTLVCFWNELAPAPLDDSYLCAPGRRLVDCDYVVFEGRMITQNRVIVVRVQ
ncbi:hypothetical protein PENSPDRAFT_671117 [Peniophora sp. CONT]|nr:hypothetical protein PENSPDRAFT_671117 [Peniophora sp. CONT]